MSGELVKWKPSGLQKLSDDRKRKIDQALRIVVAPRKTEIQVASRSREPQAREAQISWAIPDNAPVKDWDIFESPACAP